MEYPKLTREPVEPIEPVAGVRNPYLWVVLWVVCLIVVAMSVWYFVFRERTVTTEDILNLNKGELKGPSTIPVELRKAIIENSSSQLGATSTIPDDIRRIILEQSSSASESKDALPTADKRMLDTILKSSSAKP